MHRYVDACIHTYLRTYVRTYTHKVHTVHIVRARIAGLISNEFSVKFEVDTLEQVETVGVLVVLCHSCL